MSTHRRSKPIRRRARRTGENQARRSRPPYRQHWARDLRKPPAGERPPAYATVDEAPRPLVGRAMEKHRLIERFVRDGCPRGKLEEYAEAAARAAGQDPEEVVPPYTTLRGWVIRCRAWGLRGLVDRTRESQEEDARRILMRSWAIAANIGGRLTFGQTTDLLHSLLPEGEWHPSTSTVRRWIRAYEAENPSVRVLAKLGEDGFRSRYRLAFPGRSLPPGVRFAIDTTPPDLIVRVPNLTPDRDWTLVRAFLTLILDEGSRKVLTFNLSLWPVDSQILLGTLRKILVPGANYPGLPTVPVPPEMRMDAGPEYLGGFRDTIKNLGIQNYVSNTPEENGRVERIFKSCKDGALGGLPGYTPTQSPTHGYIKSTSEGRRQLTQLKYEPIRVSIPEEMVLTLPELEAHLHAWALAHNARPHTSFRTSDQALFGLRKIQQAIHSPHTLCQETSNA